MRVLIVEDDETLGDGLSVGLRLKGFTPELVTTCEDARAALEAGDFGAMVLDVMLPDGSGCDLLARLRGEGTALPVLMLSALDEVNDRITGLDAGADDYLGKPFDLDEVAARLRALSRRASGRASAEPQWNGLTLDPARMEGTMNGRVLAFSRREFTILSALMDRPGAILDRAALEDRLYGWQEGVESNAVEVHIHNLRAKLGSRFIETVRGVGYRLAAEDPA
ncbi:response regulator [Pontibaca methylaminivorans]|uniref:Transcriptional regulator, winged helix family n=1 Tax=Pontibaca methylaminivorans TaxID=515897 RepID=A0A1R3X0A5_9RHOB|nr:response regulator transcription factor [Pontibaca methylaminivorans]SIT83240.1 transcriptional regulator, winged helix family [Pontibaca methylaminivorans]